MRGKPADRLLLFSFALLSFILATTITFRLGASPDMRCLDREARGGHVGTGRQCRSIGGSASMRESGDADPLASARAVRAFLESPAVLDPFEAADGFLPSGVAEGSSTQLPADPSAPSGGKRMINGKPQKVT